MYVSLSNTGDANCTLLSLDWELVFGGVGGLNFNRERTGISTIQLWCWHNVCFID